MRVLLIEDDRFLGEAIRDHVAYLGHGVDWMRGLGEAGAAMAAVPYDLLLLDLNLPDGRGGDFLKDLRRRGSNVATIILTAQDQIASRIEGLNSGADDYLVKPFDLSELTARIGAVMRRYSGNANPVIRRGEIEVDLGRRQVSAGGSPVQLTAREWAVLERLIRSTSGIVSKSEIEDSLYEFGAEVDSNAVEVFVSRLRKKLGRDSIATIRGVGYKVAD